MKDCVVAMVNYQPMPRNIMRNIEKIDSFVSEAVANGASIVCFPEVSITGYLLPDILDCAEPIEGTIAQSIVEISRKHGVCISAGFVELLDGERYITHVLAESGEIKGVYRKTHLGHRERTLFSAGDLIPVFDVSFGKVGICVCWEYRFPEVIRVLSLKGADLIVAPFASGLKGERRKEVWNRYFPARAGDNSVYITACNMVSHDGTMGGGLMAVGPRGDVIAEDYSLDEKIVYANLSSDNLEKSRKGGTMGDNYFIMERKPPLYCEIISDSKFKRFK